MNMQRQRRQVRRSTPPVHLEVLEGRCLLATYTVTDLGTLGGASSYAFGLNDVGQVVGVAKLANLQEHAFVWDNGVMTDLDPNGMVFGGRASSANSINEAGQIVGSGFTPWHAVLWQDGKMINLNIFGGQHSAAGSINNSGQVVGGAYTPDSVHAFLWQDGVTTDLGTLPGGSSSGAAAINESGQVVGTAGTANRASHAFFWQQELGMIDLGTLPGDVDSQASGINNLGHVAGWSGDINYAQFQAFFYDGTTMIAVGPSGSVASGINDSDQVVGTMPVALHIYHAFIYTDGVVTDLNSLIPPDSGLTLEVATAINNAGQIVGYTSTLGVDPHPHAFLLTPDKGAAPGGIDLALFRLAVPASGAVTIADITNREPANALPEHMPVEIGAPLLVNTTLRQAVDAAFATHHRPPTGEGLAWLITMDSDGALLVP